MYPSGSIELICISFVASQPNHVSDIANKSKLCVDMKSLRNIVLFLTDLALI